MFTNYNKQNNFARERQQDFVRQEFGGPKKKRAQSNAADDRQTSSQRAKKLDARYSLEFSTESLSTNFYKKLVGKESSPSPLSARVFLRARHINRSVAVAVLLPPSF